jgi:hypothetical protein
VEGSKAAFAEGARIKQKREAEQSEILKRKN